MINIVCNYEKGEIKSLVIKGHSGSAPKGSDIVCSAVSAVAQGGINALDNPKEFTIIVKDGFLSIECPSNVSKHDKLVLSVILVQLKSIEESASEYVEIVEKGK